jgi:hypothetical protein
MLVSVVLALVTQLNACAYTSKVIVILSLVKGTQTSDRSGVHNAVSLAIQQNSGLPNGYTLSGAYADDHRDASTAIKALLGMESY